MISVSDYAALSAAVYSSGGVGQASMEAGWIRLQNFSDPSIGFSAALFENSAGERVLAFKGTDSFSAQDWSNNLAAVQGTVPPQFNQALDLYNQIAIQYGTEGLSLAGHSLP